jgi:hypothetical protein
MIQTRCIDCLAMGRITSRAAIHGSADGPRCDEHWRAEKRRRSDVEHGKRIELMFGITGEQYWAIYQAQGGKCYGCQRATGKKKRLAVDHRHNKPGCRHHPKTGCPKCIRALLCGSCNTVVARLDVPALKRLIYVLEHEPAQEILRRCA